MFLQKLKEFSDSGRFDMPLKSYANQTIRYVVELDSEGKYLNVIDTANPDNRAERSGVKMMSPYLKKSGNAPRPTLFADNAEYTLGIARSNSDPEKVTARHIAYSESVEKCASYTSLSSVEAILKFLKSDDTARLASEKEIDASAKMTFRIDSEFVFDYPAVQNFWAKEASRKDGQTMQCIVCGMNKTVLPRLQKKIRGIPGGQSSGTDLISANKKVFESYGLANSLIAPTCEECGEAFVESLNYMLNDDRFNIWFPSAKTIFWTKKESSLNLSHILNRPNEANVKSQIDSLWSGERADIIDTEAFYAATLSGSGGRAVVRDWIDTTIVEVIEHLRHWFDNQEMVDWRGETPPRIGIYSLARATVRESKDIPQTLPSILLRAAITGTPVPWSLLYQAVRRNRAEQRITHTRVALIKLVIMTNDKVSTQREDGYMIELDTSNKEPAYLCGRLLYVLESAQRAALGPSINTTIVDRYFGTASSAPASVFSRLLRGAQPHLAKLRRDNRPAHIAIQERITDIMSDMPAEFPRTLSLLEQGKFAIGYWHQRAHEMASIQDAKEKKLTDDFNEGEE